MFKNYLKIAIRNLWRNKAFTLINISGLAIGLSVCIIILLFVRSQTGYDQYHENKNDIYRLTLEVEGLKSGNIWKSATSSILWALVMQKEYPEVKDVCRGEYGGRIFLKDDTRYQESETVFAEESVFDFFNWTFIQGDKSRVLAEPFYVRSNKKFYQLNVPAPPDV